MSDPGRGVSREDGLLVAGQAGPRAALGRARLDLPARPRGRGSPAPGAVSALHVNYGLRDAADADERHCGELCERLGVELEVRRPPAPGAGNLQAWARDERYGAAAQLALAARARRRRRPHRDRSGRDDPLPAGVLAEPPRAAGHAPARRLAGPAAAAVHARADRRRTAASEGCAWREDESNEHGRVRARPDPRARCVPALREIHPAAEAERAGARRRSCATRPRCSTRSSTSVLDGAQEISLARLRELPAALARLVVQRLADGAAGRPAPGDGAAGRGDRGAVRPRARRLDLPHGVRAVADGGMLRFERTPPVAAGSARSYDRP